MVLDMTIPRLLLLPEELLLLIGSKLGLPKNLNNLIRTHSTFYRIFDPILWNYLAASELRTRETLFRATRQGNLPQMKRLLEIYEVSTGVGDARRIKSLVWLLSEAII